MIVISLQVQLFINDNTIEATAQFQIYPAVYIGYPIEDDLEEDEIELIDLFDQNGNEIPFTKEQEEELLMQGLRHYYQLQREKKEELECYYEDERSGILMQIKIKDPVGLWRSEPHSGWEATKRIFN